MPALQLNAQLRLSAAPSLLLAGDINADGAMELITVYSGYGGITGITAYRIDGIMLWSHGAPSAESAGPDNPCPAQVFDFDGDGLLEVVCVMDGGIKVLDGLTGKVRKSGELPGSIRCEALLPANFTRGPGAGGLLLTDDSGGLWALDENLEALWRQSGLPGVCPVVFDANLDGYDEVYTGGRLFSRAGKAIWTDDTVLCAPDSLWCGYFDLNPQAGPKFLASCAGKTSMCDVHGVKLWSAGRGGGLTLLAPGRFTGQSCFSIAALTCFDDGGGRALSLFDVQGNELDSIRLSDASLSAVGAVRNLDRSGAEYILTHDRMGDGFPVVYDGELKAVCEIPRNGVCIHADLTGCGLEDILLVSGRDVGIYSSEEKDFKKKLSYPVWHSKRLASVCRRPAGEPESSPIKNEKSHLPRNIQRKAGPSVFLMGDSTVCDQPGEPFKGWGQVLPEFFNDKVSISNYALSGRAAKSFIWEGRYADMKRRWQKGDFLLVQFGHNDQKPENDSYSEPFGDYSELLRFFVRDALSEGLVPVLISSMERRFFDENGKIIHSHGDYPEAVRRVASEFRIAYIDLNAESKKLYEAYGQDRSKELFVHGGPGEIPGFPGGIEDNTHFRYAGALEIAKLVCGGIKAQMPGLAGYIVG